MRIPVYSGDYCIELADPARVRCLSRATNTETVRRKRDGAVVQINMLDKGDCYGKRFSSGNPLKYTFLFRTERAPYGVHTLKHIPSETRSLYCTAQTDCMVAA